MLTFISCAKTMTEKTPTVLPPASSPLFIEEARHIALSMTAYTAGELAGMLHVNPQIAARTCRNSAHSMTKGQPDFRPYRPTRAWCSGTSRHKISRRKTGHTPKATCSSPHFSTGC